ESDKASMDIPSPAAGKVMKLLMKEGDQVSAGAVILELETDAAGEPAPSATPAKPTPAPVDAPVAASETTLAVPDIGGSENVDVIEVCVEAGQVVKEGESLIVLESDKASMEIRSPGSGTAVRLIVKEGDKVSAATPVRVLASGSAPKAAA